MLYSAAVSVKMNVLLMAPGVLAAIIKVLLRGGGVVGAIWGGLQDALASRTPWQRTHL